MQHVEDASEFIGKRVLLAFRTTHIDRAGETSSARVVDAEIVELDATGEALLVTDDGLHFRFPTAQLHRGGKADYIGGQELVRDLHNAIEPVTRH
jgi:hypothetical protein